MATPYSIQRDTRAIPISSVLDVCCPLYRRLGAGGSVEHALMRTLKTVEAGKSGEHPLGGERRGGHPLPLTLGAQKHVEPSFFWIYLILFIEF